MRWDRGHNSPNLEDRRGQGGGSVNILGLAGLLPLVGRLGWKGILLVVAVFLLVQYTGVCSQGDDGPAPSSLQSEESRTSAPADELVHFVGYVLDDAQASFQDDFERAGKRYVPARLVVFSDGTSSGCGGASSAVGPFYCPLDQRVYIDLSFYRELHRRFGAPGDFAQAYVIAHEIGHHVQNQLGGLEQGDRKASIDTELQADCLAGMWAADAQRRQQLEAGDMNEALDAAAAVGDDNIQRQTSGHVQPETWTHGSSEQRQRAFKKGFDGGTLQSCGF